MGGEGGLEPWTVITPPEPETAKVDPFDVAALVFPTPSVRVGLPTTEANVAVTTATTPLPMALAFMPEPKQVTDPAPLEQSRLLPAAVRAAPAEIVTEVIFVCGYESVHCKPAGADEALRERFKETEPPGTAEPELKLRELV